jgi:hypothetical protein
MQRYAAGERSAMPYTLAQAARAIGRNKTSVLRAIKAGKVSAIRDEATGGWLIEPAELHRLYPPAADAAHATGDAATRNGNDTERSGDSVEHDVDAAIRNGNAAGKIAALRALLAQERAERLRERADKDAAIDDLRRRLDAADEERRTVLRQLTALLPSAQPTPGPGKRRWWLFRRQSQS